MKRLVETEWLDELPSDDSRALGSRRDIGRLNRLMGNGKILHHLLRETVAAQPPKTIVELGGGDGLFLLDLLKQFSPEFRGAKIMVVDCKDVVTEETRAEFARLGCPLEMVLADAGDWLKKTEQPVDLIITNLFLHQFGDEQLRSWFRLASQRAKIFAACEPRRTARSFYLSRMVGLIGCNDVTRHDAPASVRAGFDGGELSTLWPAGSGWKLQERDENFFTHTFLAAKKTA